MLTTSKTESTITIPAQEAYRLAKRMIEYLKKKHAEDIAKEVDLEMQVENRWRSKPFWQFFGFKPITPDQALERIQSQPFGIFYGEEPFSKQYDICQSVLRMAQSGSATVTLTASDYDRIKG